MSIDSTLIASHAEEAMQMWNNLFPNRQVSRSQFIVWVTLNSLDATIYGISEARIKATKKPDIETSGLLAFATACMISYKKKLREKEKRREI